MSRIGKAPITVPSGVDVTIADRTVTVKGPGGTLSRVIPGAISVRQDEGTIVVERPDDARDNRSLHGLTRTLVNNMVVGVTFEVPQATRILVKGIDKEKVGQVAADIRSLRKPEPYKGKGVRYVGERILRKAGKAGKK